MSSTSGERFADWANEIAADPRRRRRVALIVIVAGFAALGIFHQRIYNTLRGPAPLEAKELAHLDDVPFRSFVQLTRDGKPLKISDLADTGLEEVKVGRGMTEHVASFRELAIDGRTIAVRVEQGGTGDDVVGLIRNNDRAAGLILDCRKTSFRSWSLLIAALGVLTVLVGLDQLRRARQPAAPTSPLRRFT